jgi:hypothetical protein
MIERLSGDGFTLVFLAPLLQPHMLGARKTSQADGLFLRLPQDAGGAGRMDSNFGPVRLS